MMWPDKSKEGGLDVPLPSSDILVHQSHIHQHHPLASGDTTNAANPVSNASANKARMRWTPKLHEAFVEAVNQFGGSERATPKGILCWESLLCGSPRD
ncbi:hypothetical protein Nepgr_012128 [Nepenthes gracilis]|uniref:Uncharacterized protein n=1 Tax=Nepenthes gracilis TaxID=150966 RepID=A0AAD3XMK0_NEPGR|nr:hypothetical protein Nepgr_012128 [Nepenthes gracilis]